MELSLGFAHCDEWIGGEQVEQSLGDA